MCSDPVTFGGGITIVKVSASGFALTPARKASASSQALAIFGSTAAES